MPVLRWKRKIFSKTRTVFRTKLLWGQENENGSASDLQQMPFTGEADNNRVSYKSELRKHPTRVF